MSPLRGINLDPTNPDGRPDPAALKALGFSAVRLVCQPPAGGPVEQYAKRCKDAGLFVLAVVAHESGGYLIANADLYQLGNEPDGQPPSSWVQNPDEYVAMWQLFRGTYPNLSFIAAGLSSGDPTWWAGVASKLDGCAGVAVHPYGKTLTDAKLLLGAYKAINPNLPLYVTEWNRPATEIPGYDWWLRQNTAGAWYFCWSDGMVDGYGLVKPELSAFGAVAQVAPTPPVVLAQPAMSQVPSPNCWSGRPGGAPIALVLHTEAGSEAGTRAEFSNTSSQVSAHFGIGLDGHIDQFVQLGDRAWANGIRESGNTWDARGLPNVNPNDLTVSIETEDDYIAGVRPAQPVSDAQYLSVLATTRWILSQCPSIRLLLRHADISPHTRPNCPGDRWVGSGRFAQLAHDLGLATFA